MPGEGTKQQRDQENQHNQQNQQDRGNRQDREKNRQEQDRSNRGETGNQGSRHDQPSFRRWRCRHQVPRAGTGADARAATDGREYRHASTGTDAGSWEPWDPAAAAAGNAIAADDARAAAGVDAAITTALRPNALLDALAIFDFTGEDG